MRVRLLVHRGCIAEVVVLPDASTLTHDELVAFVRRHAVHLSFAPGDAERLWILDQDFGQHVLLTDWAVQWNDNGRPSRVELWVGLQHSPAAALSSTPPPALSSSAAGGGGFSREVSTIASNHRMASMTTGELFLTPGGGHHPIFVDPGENDGDNDGGMSRMATFLNDVAAAPTAATAAAARPHQRGATAGASRRVSAVPWGVGAAPVGKGDSHHQHHSTHLRIFLVRHGESEANVNKAIYRTVPDHAVSLTERGKAMAVVAGRRLRNCLKTLYGTKERADHHIRMFVSPFNRTRQTAEGVLRALNDCEEQWVDSVKESTLLAEQDWGAMEGEGSLAQTKYSEEMERNQIKLRHGGKFWARQPGGESSFDVCQRVSAFFPDILLAANSGTTERKAVRTVIIVSHGVTIRAFLTMWCRYSPEWFGKSRNPPNCSVAMLEDNHDRGYLFGGWEGDSDTPIDVADLAGFVDPMQQRWGTVLNQAAAADPVDMSTIATSTGSLVSGTTAAAGKK